MKRAAMIMNLVELLMTLPADVEEAASDLLTSIEKLGMLPPTLPEDKCQAILSVYYGGYSFNKWDEDFEKDAKVVAALNRRLASRRTRNEKE